VDASLVMTALAEPLRIARSYPNSQIRVYAYTDSSGASAANQTLSQKRAESVAAIVVSKGGVALSRVKAIGRGEADPVASNDTRAGRAANRRIVVVLLPGGAA
jgi:outer membrane protein OmpA-like peptidoglycan-associated protein